MDGASVASESRVAPLDGGASRRGNSAPQTNYLGATRWRIDL